MAGTWRLPCAGAGTSSTKGLTRMRHAFLVASTQQAADLVIDGAGSLRASIGEIAKEFGEAHGVAAKTHFGPSGRLVTRAD